MIANRLSGQQFWVLLWTTAKEWWNDNALRLAASLAFYTTFSLAPTLLIVTGIAGFFFQGGGATDQIERQIRDLMGPEGAAVIRGILEGVGREHQSSVLATLIGIGTVIIGSTAVFGELQAALNQIWDVKVDATRGVIGSLIRDRLLSFGVVLGIGFLMLVSLVVSAALAAARDWIAQGIPGFGWLWEVLNALVSVALTTALFVLMYKLLPDVELTWRDVFVGAAVTAVLFSVGKVAIGLYLGRASVGSYYGAAGSFVVLLVWVYYSALVFFFGAEFTHVYAQQIGTEVQPREHAVRKGDKPAARPRTSELPSQQARLVFEKPLT